MTRLSFEYLNCSVAKEFFFHCGNIFHRPGYIYMISYFRASALPVQQSALERQKLQEPKAQFEFSREYCTHMHAEEKENDGLL